MCYSVINPCGYWTSGTLSAHPSNGNTLYDVVGVKRHIMPVDLPESESIRGITLISLKNVVAIQENCFKLYDRCLISLRKISSLPMMIPAS